MKTILIPTDFSDNAAYALHYSAALAAHNESKLLLVHIIPLETLTTMEGSEVVLPPDPRQEAYYHDKLARYGQHILADMGLQLQLEVLCVHGTLPDTLHKLACNKQAELVVMGTKGAQKLADNWLGTNTFNFIRQAQCPVLVIPGKATFQGIKRIAIATDFETPDESVYLRQLLAFAQAFHPEVYLVNIQQDDAGGLAPDSKVLRNLKARFPDNAFHVVQIRGDEVVPGLEHFVQEYQIEVLAVAIQKRSFWAGLFHRSVSKQLAFHSSGPLLFLPPHPYRLPAGVWPGDAPQPEAHKT